MAKFCTKCGKPLEEGMTCDCQVNVVEQQANVAVAPQSTDTKIDIKESLMDCVNVFKKVFTKPFEAIKEFVCDSKFIAGIIMIVVTALSNGLYKIASLKNTYEATANSLNLNDFSSLLNSALSGNSAVAEPEYLKEFFTSFLTNFAEYAVVFVLGYLIISKLFKGTISWKQMLNAVAISLSVVLVGNLLRAGLTFVDGDFIYNIRSYISSFANIFSILLLYGAAKEVSGIDNNKMFISVASMSVFATLVMDLVDKVLN